MDICFSLELKCAFRTTIPSFQYNFNESSTDVHNARNHIIAPSRLDYCLWRLWLVLHGLVNFNAIHEDFKVILLNSYECEICMIFKILACWCLKVDPSCHLHFPLYLSLLEKMALKLRLLRLVKMSFSPCCITNTAVVELLVMVLIKITTTVWIPWLLAEKQLYMYRIKA